MHRHTHTHARTHTHTHTQVVELEYRGKSPAIEAEEATNTFVTIQAGNGPTFDSDVHNGAKDTAVFNWRYVFDVEQPTRYTKLTVQIWDTRLTSANESLAECTLQLQTLYNNVRRAPSRVHEVPRQFYQCTHPLYPGQQASQVRASTLPLKWPP